VKTRPGQMDKMKPLRAWLQSMGGHIHEHLVFGENSSGLQGIYSTGDIVAGTELISVPAELCLGPTSLEQYDRRPPLTVQPEVGAGVVALFTEFSQGGKSRYLPYFELLPTLAEYQLNMPYCCSDAELAEINNLSPRCASIISDFRAMTNEICVGLALPPEHPDVMWAALNYVTRAFGEHGLVPGCDFFNHKADLGSRITGQRTIRACSDVADGEELYISYGHNDSLYLWARYGFLDSEAEAAINCSDITFHLGTDDAAARTAEWLRSRGHPLSQSREGALKVTFSNEVYFTASGPSDEAIVISEAISGGSPGTAGDGTVSKEGLEKLRQLLSVFRGEINEAALNAECGSSLAEILRGLLKDRLAIIDANLRWVSERAI